MTIPTAIGINDYHFNSSNKASGLEDLDFHIGQDAVRNSASYSVSYPVRHGIVSVLLNHACNARPEVKVITSGCMTSLAQLVMTV